MDNLGDNIATVMIWAITVVALVMAVVVVGMVVVPLGLAGAGFLYWKYNIQIPEQRRRSAEERVERLYLEAKQLSPSQDELINTLLDAGVTDPDLHAIARKLYDQEGLRPPILPPVRDDPIKLGQYQDDLERFINAAQPDHYARFERHLIWALLEYEPVVAEAQMFHSKRERTRREIEDLILRFINDDGLFPALTNQFNANYQAEGEVMPSACKHDDYALRYLRGTPLSCLTHVDQMVGLEDRMYHTYLLGSSGSGKTNLLEKVIAHDLQSDEDCCVIVIDSQTQLIDKLAKIDLDHVTYITPKFDLALNLFDVGYDKLKGQGIEGETLINKTVGLLSFVLEGMMHAEFTAPQKTIFQYVIQLVISIKDGNIHTFMDVLAEGSHERYADDIAKLDPNLQRFFTVDFIAPDYKRTREAIRRRIDSLLLNPTFRRLFSATENKIDMLEEMERRDLILIDTNKPMLDDAPSAFFGRLFIAMILRAAHRRFQSGGTMRPVYLVVDEAHEYFDRSISDMLEQARKANIGLIVSHQSISQARGAKGGSNITDPLMVNTGTKLIWTSFREDATKFAGSMQVKADDILNLPQFTFGMYTRKQGFLPVRGVPDALQEMERRKHPEDLQDEMECLYGSTSRNDKNGSEYDSWTDLNSNSPNRKNPKPDGRDLPPEVELI